jgi:hypothetical protein
MLLLLEATMRALKIAAIVLLTSTFIYAQPSKKNVAVASDVTQGQDLAYPTAGYLPPKIPLPRALKIAEAFIKHKRIDISSCHLIEAKWVVDETKTKNGGWRFLWAHPNEVSRFVLIAVSVDGKPYLIHLM